MEAVANKIINDIKKESLENSLKRYGKDIVKVVIENL